jgi:hypothetical protein
MKTKSRPQGSIISVGLEKPRGIPATTMSKHVTLTTLTPTYSGKFLQCYSNQFSTSDNLSEAKFFCRIHFNQFKDLDVVEITTTMHRFAPLLYSICWLLHVSAVVCHHQGASGSV